MRTGSSKSPPKRGGVVKTLLYVLLFPVYLAARVIPKDSRLHVFGSCHGLHFADNSKYLFLYASKHAKDIHCVFVSRNREVVNDLRRNGYRACYLFTKEGITTAVRAKKCFISHSTHDVHTLLVGGAQVIQLWHGTPLKAIGRDMNQISGSLLSRLKYTVRAALFWLFPYLETWRSFDRLVVASEYVKASFRSAFTLKDEDMVVLGQARNDSLHESYSFDEKVFPEVAYLKQLKEKADYIVSWLPTHRLRSGGTIADLLSSFEFDIVSLEDLLARHNAVLAVKVHFLDHRGLKDRFRGSQKVLVYDYTDPYPLLRFTDVLMTDYSSVYLDFLLLNRPLVFTPFDYEQYVKQDATFYYDYDTVTPGEKCRDWKEVAGTLDCLLTGLKRGERDPYAERRVELSRLFNEYHGESSKQIINRLFESPRR